MAVGRVNEGEYPRRDGPRDSPPSSSRACTRSTRDGRRSSAACTARCRSISPRPRWAGEGPALRRRSARTRPGNAEPPKNQFSIAYRGLRIDGSDPVWCRNSSSKNSASPGSKIGRITGVAPPPPRRPCAGRSCSRAPPPRWRSPGSASSRVGSRSRPGDTSPQRDSDSHMFSERTVAHEEPVLVPGARHRRIGLAQRRLVDRDQRRLAEVAADQLPQPGAREQLHHLEVEHAARPRRAARRPA